MSHSTDWSVTEEKVAIAVDRIVRTVDPLRIIAFGSRAKGSARPDSDLDVAVILGESASNNRPLRYSSLFQDLHLPMDVLVTSLDHHQRLRGSVNSIHHDIAREGNVLYDKTYGSQDRSAIGKFSG